MLRALRIPLIVVGALVIAVAGLYSSIYAFAKPREYVSIGTPIRQDDFTYTVTSARKTSTIGNGSQQVHARGVFFVVTVRLDNHALRVPFGWDDDIVRIVDASGRSYHVAASAQAVLAAQSAVDRTIPAGEHASFQIAVDAPRDIQRPAVAFENGILMGDAFDLVAYRRVAVALQ